MRKYYSVTHSNVRALTLVLIASLFPAILKAQKQQISEYAVFGGTATVLPDHRAPLSPGYGVQMGSSSSVLPSPGGQIGSIGSYKLVKSTGNLSVTGNIYSNGIIDLSNSNSISGRVAANNAGNLPASSKVLNTGSSFIVGGKIDVKGSIYIKSGTVTGTITYPGSPFTYSGPKPAVVGTPDIPQLPDLPAVTSFANTGTTDITTTISAGTNPGTYRNVLLGGGKTITFNGPGNYYFNSIRNSGTTNNFVFDFQGKTGLIRIFVKNEAELNKVKATVKGGGDASRIYMEVQGRCTSSNPVAFSIANGSSGSASKWMGTVWAPNAAINIGSGTGSTDITGTLWSGTQVNIQSGVSIIYTAPMVDDGVIKPFNGSLGKVSTIIGSELTSLTEQVTDEARKVLVVLGTDVLIEVVAKVGQEAAVLSYLLSQGMTGIISNGNNTLITTGRFPIANLLNLNTRTDIINFVQPVFAPLGNSGLIRNAGDTAMGSHLVRNGYDLQGEGVKIGVLSDGFNTLVTSTNNPANVDTSSRDLPGLYNPINNTPVQVLLEYPYGTVSDEGRAMLQVIHDVAPKADLVFRTGFISAGDLAVGIGALQQAGCKVIVDDVTFINEPFLQDGPVARAVDDVKNLGVSYFTSAGNFSNKSHSQVYRPAAAPAGFAAGTTAHDFSGTGDIYQRITLRPGSYTIVLQWEDDIYSIGQTQSGGTDNDFDIYLTDMSGNIICGYNRVNTFGDPLEFLAYTVSNTVTQVDANILITRANPGVGTPRFKFIIFRGDPAFIEYQTGTSTITGHANATGAITVGAVNYFNTPAFGGSPVIAPYSSIGGTLVGSVNRNKPDITAPDGVNTSVNMGADITRDTDPFSNFFGTSAAAPNAAAVAALLIEGRKRFLNEVATPAQVKTLLQTTAVPFGSANATGAGLIQADLAMRSFAAPTPSLISLEFPSSITPTSYPTSSFQMTVNGEFLTEESQVLFRGQQVPTTYVSPTELTATIPAFSNGNPAVQVYTAPLANGDGGYSNIVNFFDIPKVRITVTADSKTKLYGAALPPFTSVVMVGNQTLAQSGLSLTALGLNTLTYSTNATLMSNIGNQYFIKPVRTFNPTTNAADAALLEIYTYDTVPGILTIEKLPVTVVANDQTITYGQDIAPITFKYQIDPAIANANPDVVTNIRLSHEEFLADDVVGLVNWFPVAISNGGLRVAISNGLRVAISNGGLRVAISNGEEIPIYNAQSVTGFDVGIATVVPYTLTQQQLANLSFYATEKSLLSTRQLTTNTKVVDIAQESIINYKSDPGLTNMVNTIDPSKPKGIFGAQQLANASSPVAIFNGGLRVALSNTLRVALSNGGLRVAISNNEPFPISNGGLRIAISNSFTEQANRIAVIIDQSDVEEQTEIVLRALNTVTGITAGTQYIIPGSVLNDNYAVTYGLGRLTVNPAALTVKAKDTSRLYGEPNPVFRAIYTGLKYGETFETSNISGSPLLTTLATQASPAGIYDICAALGTLSSTNYTFNSFQKGKLTIGTNPCLLTHKAFTNFGSTINNKVGLWLSVVTKVSGQLNNAGDYLLYQFGTVTLNNITSSSAINNYPIPTGKIIADNAVSAPVTHYDAATKTWITRVPVGFSSTSDIFITGVILNSNTGFIKKNGANSVITGIFYSNKTFSDQWGYGIAAYYPQFTYEYIGTVPGQVVSVNGTYKAGTPTRIISTLINGGSGGGGNNYTGSSSAFDNFSACRVSTSNAVTSSRGTNNSKPEETVAETEEDLNFRLSVAPNPVETQADISFVPFVTGPVRVTLYGINGVAINDIYSGLGEKDKLYRKKVNVSTVSPGVYFIQLQNGGKREIRKIVIAR